MEEVYNTKYNIKMNFDQPK